MASEGWEDNPHLKKIFIAKMREQTTEEMLREYFGKYGTVTECEVIKDKDDKSRCFAFVSMDNQAVVDTILDEKPHSIDGNLVYVRRRVPRDDPTLHAESKTKKLFIGGLHSQTTPQDILDVLAIFTSHKPKRLTLMRDHYTGNFKGYAFAMFENEDIVDKLFIIRTCMIKNKRVEMKKAEEIPLPPKGHRGRAGAVGPQSESRGGGRGSFRGGPGGYGPFPFGYGFGGGFGMGFGPGFNYGPYAAGYGGGYGNMWQCGGMPSGYGPNRSGSGSGRGGGRGGRQGKGKYKPY